MTLNNNFILFLTKTLFLLQGRGEDVRRRRSPEEIVRARGERVVGVEAGGAQAVELVRKPLAVNLPILEKS